MSGLGTKYVFVGGNNAERIGGSCSIIEHKYDSYRRPTRIMLDLGSLFAPDYCMDVDAAIPDVRQYFNSEDSLAEKAIDAIFLSHGHEDHIGGYVHLARAGFEMPSTYASKPTLELLKSALFEAGVEKTKWPKMYEVEAGTPISFDGVEIEAINVSHSTMGALGYHILTEINGKPEAGIFHPGDYHLGEVRVGKGFNSEELKDLLQRKPLTNVILDSTSSATDDKYLITHSQAVANTLEVVKQHPEKQVISAVISRSVQNLAIDLEVAKETGRKVFLDGYWAKIAFKAMQKSGVADFDDVVFDGSAEAYKSKFPASKRYLIPSGAFAESKKGKKSGLYKMSEQEKVKSGKQKKEQNEEKKQRIGHPDFTVDSNTLILARQRCIEEINGKEVRAMYARLAALGATIVANEAETPLGHYQTAKMQRSGHAVLSETKKMVQLFQKYAQNPSDVIFIPTHGNPTQMINTAKVVKSQSANLYFGNNLDVLQMKCGKTIKVDEISSEYWIGVCEESDNVNGTQTYTYTEIDKNFIVQRELKTIQKRLIRQADKFKGKRTGKDDNKNNTNRKQINNNQRNKINYQGSR